MQDVTNATNERTAIFSVRPYLPSNDKLPSVFVRFPAAEVACLVANLSSFVFDYVARQKIGGTNLGGYIVEQLPVLPPFATWCYVNRKLNGLTARLAREAVRLGKDDALSGLPRAG